MNDTSPELDRRYQEMLMSLSPEERLKMACRMHGTARKLVVAGILMTEPNITPERLRLKLFLRMYGCDFSLAERKKIIENIFGVQSETVG